MPLKNPYDYHVNSSALGVKFQCDVDPLDKALITSLRPARGTLQLVVLNLLKNLCNDLRDLGINHYCVDGDEILDILTGPKPLSRGQIERLRRTTVGTIGEIPPRFFLDSRGTSVREKVAGTKTKSSDATKRTSQGVQRNRTTSRKA